MAVRIMKPAAYKQEQQLDYGTEAQHDAVKQIVAAVAEQGDEALRQYTKQFDRMEIRDFRVEETVIQAAYSDVDKVFLEALRRAADRIRSFHEKQKRLSWHDSQPDGSMLGQLIRPLKRVGLYVPGGTAAYPSSVLMNVIPAQVAGVKEIALATPPSTAGEPGINPYILVAAAELGIQEIYRVGGAQAIAAMAYGTESIPAVDKICGPGNIYVALAKRYVYGKVDIDSIAGPSDITVLADEHADPSYVAADLLSQAEHDALAQAVLVTASPKLAEQVQQEIERQLESLPRKEIAARSLADNGAIIVADSLDECVDTVNRIAPEHLELLVEEPFALLGRIENAGAIFLGPYSSEPVGDYYAGPNHILPTGGTARYASPLNVDDFLKKTSLIYYSKAALAEAGPDIMTLARGEGLEGHARAIAIRLEKEGM
ncbi:histidinol dehydrogenase [Xylanibacillus composti]|uniref:Histidinol dehydrogenase n=1 Tax=Xylanibacillus composti TaxID=1572762 RepID=A0A8J4H112_9BACL|nr:histidinol dehydrogenase [Xylanibacillus composti]MDT9725068.1 histidinol dehydrogenase [Xylanibacillus composti]GIQ67452.1 histidinol dehydrogenase [Xylanibacillus composti]